MELSAGRRPPEEAALFNPAFIAALLLVAAADYRSVRKGGMPFALAFLVLPLALDAETRSALPRNTNTRLSTWLTRNPVIEAAFPAKAAAMAGIVRAGLRYGLRSGAIGIDEGAGVTARRRITETSLATEDTRECFHAAAFAGRWFAKTGDAGTIFGLLGVRP